MKLRSALESKLEVVAAHQTPNDVVRQARGNGKGMGGPPRVHMHLLHLRLSDLNHRPHPTFSARMMPRTPSGWR